MNLSKQEFLNCGQSAKYIQANHGLRQQLESDVAEWLANGGKIQDLGGVGNVPKPEYSPCKPDDFISFHKASALKKWARLVPKRLKRLEVASGLGRGRAQGILAFNNAVRMKRSEYEWLCSLKPEIEKMESL